MVNTRNFGSLHVRPPLAGPGNRIGLLGGSFNPPHQGHLLIAELALKRLALDSVWWLVSPGNPVKSHHDLENLGARLRAARQLASNKRMVVTGFESALPTNYTAETVKFLKRRYPSVRFVWLMGADNLISFHKWQHWQDIFETLPIAVLDRPGYRLAAMASQAAHKYHSAQIRESAATGLPLEKAPAWTYLTHRLSPLSSTELRR